MFFKKIVAVALSLTCILSLTACKTSKVVKDKNGNYVLAKLKGKNITSEEVYKDIIKTNKTVLFQAVLQQLIDEKFPITKSMETDADTIIDQIKSYYESQYSTNATTQLKAALATYGYSSISAYRKVLIKQVQTSTFLLNYVKRNYTTVFNDYYQQTSPRYISMIYIKVADTSSLTEAESKKLEEVKNLLNTSKSFEEIAKSYSDDSTTAKNNGNLGIVDSTSGLASSYGDDVQTKALALKNGEVSEPILGTSGYYILKCTNDSKSDIKKQMKKDLSIDSPLITYDSYMQYLAFKSYKIKYSDKTIKKLVEEVISGALKNRESSRKGS